MNGNDEKELELALEEFGQKLKALSDENPEKLTAFLAELERKLDELEKVVNEPFTD